MKKKKNAAAVALGSRRSPRKAEAARENGKRGGRPPLRFFVMSIPGRTDDDEVVWFVFDRRTRTAEAAPSYHRARVLSRQRNAEEAQ